MMPRRDAFARASGLLPQLIANRVRGSVTKVTEDPIRFVLSFETRITLFARCDLALETATVGGEDALAATATELVKAVERHAAEAFAPMLSERERDLRRQVAALTDRVRRAEGIVDQIAEAWTVEGPAPEVHQRAKQDLRRSWPMLAAGVERAATPDPAITRVPR